MRKIAAASAIVLGVSCTSIALSNDGFVSIEDLAGAMVAFDRTPRDSFTPHVQPVDLNGKHFRISLPMSKLDSPKYNPPRGFSGWYYDADAGHLILKPLIAYVFGNEMKSDAALKENDAVFNGFLIKTNGQDMGKKAMSTAFGAHVVVQNYWVKSFIIGSYHDRKKSLEFPNFDPLSDPVFTVNMSPDAARAIAPHLKMIVEGSVAQYSPGKSVACGDSLMPATLDRHTEILDHQCVMDSEIERFSVVDDRDGHVLAEWKP